MSYMSAAIELFGLTFFVLLCFSLLRNSIFIVC
jgi:hypothetical protein